MGLKDDIAGMKEPTNRYHEKLLKSSIIIYGAGENGRWTYEKCKSYAVLGFVDDFSSNSINGINVYKQNILMEMDLSNLCVIVSFFIKGNFEYEKIKKRLTDIGVKEENILYFIDVFMGDYFDWKRLSNELDDVMAAYDGLEDNISKVIYENYIKAVLNSDASWFMQPSSEEQYFDKEILKNVHKEFQGDYFIDCGAYKGDTYECFTHQQLNMNYIGFEPDINNFKALVSQVNTLKGKYQAICFPCATSKELKTICFQSSVNGISSVISDSGDTVVPCLPLDYALKNLPVAFIKMDVEGAEYDSLMGAEKIIKKYHPILAICTYHRLDDMWRLQNLIHSFDSTYKFYMRSYYLYGRETVLYAI